MEEPAEYEIKPRTSFTPGIAELVQYRELFYFFTWRDIKVKYKQTVLGFAWTVLQPLLMMVLFTLFFSRAISPSAGALPYPVFVLSGLLPWMLFSSGLANAGNSMVANANMIKKIYFPRLILPISAVLVALFDMLMALPVFAGVLLFYGVAPGWQAVWCVPLALVLIVITTVGAGCLLSALTLKYRDFRYIIPFLIQILLFATPVIYPPGFVQQKWIAQLLMLNPMSGAVSLFRAMFHGQGVDAMHLALSGAMALLLLLAGVFYFRKTESYFADLA
ncbi:MAG: ABC transporter permease [Bacteroidia bacterium]|jgi:lipopolysaccharide transport system permease protein|nr:ABC transporter permease [Bacteroidia bacterium]